jgi:hypothetical protein
MSLPSERGSGIMVIHLDDSTGPISPGGGNTGNSMLAAGAGSARNPALPARPDRLCSPNTSPYKRYARIPVAAARTRAISCRIPLDRADPVIGDRLKTGSGNCGKCRNRRTHTRSVPQRLLEREDERRPRQGLHQPVCRWERPDQGFPKVAMRSTLQMNSTRFSSIAGSRSP